MPKNKDISDIRRRVSTISLPLLDNYIPPDGGWGWIVCIAIFFLNFTVAGVGTSSGIILLGLVDAYNVSESKAAMVGSLCNGSIMSGGPLVLFMLSLKVSHRQVIIIGGIVSAISTITSAFAPKLEYLYITHGIITGCSIGVAYFAGNTILASYFSKKRSLAVSIAFSGGGTGVFCLNYIIEQSIAYYGMTSTFLILSGIFLNISLYGVLCRPLDVGKKVRKKVIKETFADVLEDIYSEDQKTNQESSWVSEDLSSSSKKVLDVGKARESVSSTTVERKYNKYKRLVLRLLDCSIYKEPGLQILLFIYLFWSVGDVLLVFLPSNIVNIGLGRKTGALVMSVYGVFITIGGFVVGLVIDFLHIPISFILSFSILAMAIVAIYIPFCHTFIDFATCTAIYGFFNGCVMSIRVLLAAIILGIEHLDKVYSPLCLMVGVGYVIFPLIIGKIYDDYKQYEFLFYFIGSILSTGFIATSGVIYMQMKGKFKE